MPILVSRRAPRSQRVDRRRLRAMADRMLRALELEHAELSILLTDDDEMRVLNREHRDKDRPTDVLAFPLGPHATVDGAPQLLGDIVISIDTAERHARGRRRPLLDEIRLLLAHGLLHLIGYDHATRAQKRRMDARTRSLMRACAPEQASLTPSKRRPRRRRAR